MEILNIEIKAKCNQFHKKRQILKHLKAEFKGIDHQIDTYFQIQQGRLKLREGNIEQSLIFYNREDINKPKPSKVLLYQPQPESSLKDILSRSLGILVVVDKIREIYFIENVKFHLDKVKYLGTFIEIEAIDNNGTIGKQKLEQQCKYYLKKLNIQALDLISSSYSDMLLQRSDQVVY